MKFSLWTTVIVLGVFLTVSGEFMSHDRRMRIKRQSNAGDALVDAVFQIPIQTLTSVGSLVKATRPVIMQVRQRIQQNLATQPQRFSFGGRPQASSYQRPSRAHDRVSQSYQRPTSIYNKLQQQPHRFTTGTNQYFRNS